MSNKNPVKENLVSDTRATAELWLFNWKQGGYNTVMATNRKAALALARHMESPYLTVSESSLRLPKDGEVDALDAHYAGMFI